MAWCYSNGVDQRAIVPQRFVQAGWGINLAGHWSQLLRTDSGGFNVAAQYDFGKA
jgi:hypothetical protein